VSASHEGQAGRLCRWHLRRHSARARDGWAYQHRQGPFHSLQSGAGRGPRHQEGFRTPPSKLCKQGELDEELLALILTNVRTPGETRGDLQAQLAASDAGQRRLQELLKKHGQAMVFSYI
jgi:hypothetical protein